MAQLAEFIIREIISKDYDLLVDFFDKNNIPEVTRMFHPFSLNRKSAYTIACTDHLDLYYVALADNKVISLCMLRGWDDGYPIPSFGVLVDRNFQNLGVGKKISVYVINEATRLRCKRVRLTVFASNKVALNLYTSLGFIEDSREIVQVMGDSDEKVIMFKDLP